jgi:hypothetical protein
LISDRTIISLERQSIINAIFFYKEELLKIDEGEKATDHFNERQRKSLVKQGILSRNYGHGGCRLELTSQTKQIIQNMVTSNI